MSPYMLPNLSNQNILHQAGTCRAIGQAKEGFSVFGILNKCVSAMGKRLLRLWFARPIVNLAVLNDRLDAVEFFVQRPDAIKSLRQVHCRGSSSIIGGGRLPRALAKSACQGHMYL